ncbi:hypothetical protein HK405_011359, partial [Cladochytrium tenue]
MALRGADVHDPRSQGRRPISRHGRPIVATAAAAATATVLLALRPLSVAAASVPAHWAAGNPVVGSSITVVVGYLANVDQAYLDDNADWTVSESSIGYSDCVAYAKNTVTPNTEVDMFTWSNASDYPGCYIKKYADDSNSEIIWGGDLNWISSGKTFDDSDYGSLATGQSQSSCASM